ncbi:hypothetical protein PENSUB_5260 [Penicillium subrubescens]|uniref:Uncharacterized protein n=1 Tax=Penicillium subrubescens TaxID=1316194 RepID=A0A1Q5UAD8_9EURO|nr:hypothetical protein PENSUB_5260 [Penicillium subrubescens]
MKDDHRKIVYETINMLNSRLVAAEVNIESAMKKELDYEEAQVNRWKYMLSPQSINKSVDALEQWQKVFDLSWFLAISRVGPLIDGQLSEWKQSPVEDGRVPPYIHCRITAIGIEDCFKCRDA